MSALDWIKQRQPKADGVSTALPAQGKMPWETGAESWEERSMLGEKSRDLSTFCVLYVLLKPSGLAEATSSCLRVVPALLQALCRQ